MELQDFEGQNEPVDSRTSQKTTLIIAGIAIASLAIGGTIWAISGSANHTRLPQSQTAVQLPQSDTQQSETHVSDLFREATGNELKQIQAEYDLDALSKVSEPLDPFRAKPFGAYPYRIKVAQKWKDTFPGVDWQTMSASLLSDLEKLWSDPTFTSPNTLNPTEGAGALEIVRGLTYRDVIFSKLSPVFSKDGVEPERSLSNGDIEYYNSIVPILGVDGTIPGTTIKPPTPERKVTIESAELLLPDANDVNEVYANYPKLKIRRIADYSGSQVAQDLTFYVQHTDTGWKIVEVKSDAPTLKE